MNTARLNLWPPRQSEHQDDREQRDERQERHRGHDAVQQEVEERARPAQRSFQLGKVDARERIRGVCVQRRVSLVNGTSLVHARHAGRAR